MAARTNHAPGGGEDGEGQPTAIRDVRGWTRQCMYAYLGADQPLRINGLLKALVDGSLQ